MLERTVRRSRFGEEVLPCPLHALSRCRPVIMSACACSLHRGKANARTFKRARVLLKLSAGWREPRSRTYDVSQNTIGNVRTRFLWGGLEAVLSDKRQERRRQALTGAQQAHLIAIACSDVPEGHDHWTLRMLAGKAVELGYVDHIALETIRSLLKRTSSSRGSIASGASPTVGGEFVAAMEDVLDLYEEPYDPAYPTVCLDEKPVVLHTQTRSPLPAHAGAVMSSVGIMSMSVKGQAICS